MRFGLVLINFFRFFQIPLDLIDEVYSAYFWFSKRCEEYHLTRLKPPPEFDNSVGKHIQRDIELVFIVCKYCFVFLVYVRLPRVITRPWLSLLEKKFELLWVAHEIDNETKLHLKKTSFCSGYLKRYSGEEKKVRQMIFTHVKDRDACIAGADSMDTVSLEDFGAFAELPGGNVILGKGKKSFFELCLRLAEPLGSDRIKMSCRVNKIRWDIYYGL